MRGSAPEARSEQREDRLHRQKTARSAETLAYEHANGVHSVAHMEGIMHALKEQQRRSFEQRAQVLAVLQEQRRQLQGLLIDREKIDNATNREHREHPKAVRNRAPL